MIIFTRFELVFAMIKLRTHDGGGILECYMGEGSF